MVSPSQPDVEPAVNHQRIHWLEKFQVQLVTAGVLAIMYFFLYRHVAPWDAQLPLSFLATGNAVKLSALFLIAMATAGAVALMTISARPGGAIMAAIIGVGGLALKSQTFRTLLWLRQNDLSSMYLQLIAEVVLLTVMAISAGLVVLAVRELVRRVSPRLVWRDPLLHTLAAPRHGVLQNHGFLGAAARTLGLGVVDYTTRPGKDLPIRAATRGELTNRLAGCVLMSTAIAFALLTLLMKSDERGQTLFAVLVSFLLAVMIAHSISPAPYPLVAWMGPLLAAVAMYGWGATVQVGPLPQSWIQVPIYARALPIDWMTFGIGGGLLGYWFSARIHEARHLEQGLTQESE